VPYFKQINDGVNLILRPPLSQ